MERNSKYTVQQILTQYTIVRSGGSVDCGISRAIRCLRILSCVPFEEVAEKILGGEYRKKEVAL